MCVASSWLARCSRTLTMHSALPQLTARMPTGRHQAPIPPEMEDVTSSARAPKRVIVSEAKAFIATGYDCQTLRDED